MKTSCGCPLPLAKLDLRVVCDDRDGDSFEHPTLHPQTPRRTLTRYSKFRNSDIDFTLRTIQHGGLP
jgi:hypothetical protein